MRDFSFYILLLSALIPVIQAYRKPARLYELPFLYSIALLVYILPTLFGIKNLDSVLTDAEYIRYTLFASLCFWSAVGGYELYKPKIKKQQQKDFYNEKKMLYVLYVVLIVSFVGVIVAGNYAADDRQGGSYAIVLYFARLMRPATIILFILWLLNPSKDKLFFLLVSFLLSLKIIIIDGRRSEVFNLFITIAFPLYFLKGKIIARSLILPGLLVSLIVFTFLPAARQYTLNGDFKSAFALSPTDILAAQVQAENTNEVVEAAKNMQVADVSGNYNYGSTLYNSFVLQFASATVFGETFKKSLLLKTNLDLEDLRSKYAKTDNSEFRFYLAPTGFAAAFFEFGYAGFILFFLFGVLTKYFFEKASQITDIFTIVFYCFFATFILFSVYDSIFSIPVILILYMIVFYATKKRSQIKVANHKLYE